MTQNFLRPEFGAPMASAHPSLDAVKLLRLRRSTAADLLGDPGPDAETLQTMLEIAARVPDHRRVYPFRFIVFEGGARERAGEILADCFDPDAAGAGEDRLEAERRRFLRAPCVVAVVSAVDRTHKTPEWEQVLTVGAVCQNLLLAASALGFGACWITEWYGYDRRVLDRLGLGPDERIAGYVYIGTAREAPRERQRLDLDKLVTRFPV